MNFWFGDIHGPKTFKFLGFRGAFNSQTPVTCKSPKTAHEKLELAQRPAALTRLQAGYRSGSEAGSRVISGLTRGLPTTFKEPARNLRVRAGFVPKADPNQTQNIRHGTHKPAHNDSERFWAGFGVFRRRSETSQL